MFILLKARIIVLMVCAVHYCQGTPAKSEDDGGKDGAERKSDVQLSFQSLFPLNGSRRQGRSSHEVISRKEETTRDREDVEEKKLKGMRMSLLPKLEGTSDGANQMITLITDVAELTKEKKTEMVENFNNLKNILRKYPQNMGTTERKLINSDVIKKYLASWEQINKRHTKDPSTTRAIVQPIANFSENARTPITVDFVLDIPFGFSGVSALGGLALGALASSVKVPKFLRRADKVGVLGWLKSLLFWGANDSEDIHPKISQKKKFAANHEFYRYPHAPPNNFYYDNKKSPFYYSGQNITYFTPPWFASKDWNARRNQYLHQNWNTRQTQNVHENLNPHQTPDHRQYRHFHQNLNAHHIWNTRQNWNARQYWHAHQNRNAHQEWNDRQSRNHHQNRENVQKEQNRTVRQNLNAHQNIFNHKLRDRRQNRYANKNRNDRKRHLDTHQNQYSLYHFWKLSNKQIPQRRNTKNYHGENFQSSSWRSKQNNSKVKNNSSSHDLNHERTKQESTTKRNGRVIFP